MNHFIKIPATAKNTKSYQVEPSGMAEAEAPSGTTRQSRVSVSTERSRTGIGRLDDCLCLAKQKHQARGCGNLGFLVSIERVDD